MKICFCFDEDWEDPGGAWGWRIIQKALLKAYISSTPRHRRHAKFGFGTLPIADIAQAVGSLDKAVGLILGEQWVVWSTFAGPDLSRYAVELNIAGMTVDSMTPADARAMHVALSGQGGYLGAIQILPAIRAHWLTFEQPIPVDFRVYGEELRIFYRAFESEFEDDRDHVTFRSWVESGLFSAVRWEDSGVRGTIFDPYDTMEHAGRTGELESLLSGQLAFALNEVLIRSSELDPRLTLRLHAAIRAFEDHDTVEQLAHVSLSCRRYLEKLADALYPARKEKTNGREVGQSQYRNRLWAYISDEMESGTAREVTLANLKDLGDRVDALDSGANKGLHAENTASEVNRLLVTLLLVSHDILTLTTPGDRISYDPYREHITGLLKDWLAAED